MSRARTVTLAIAAALALTPRFAAAEELSGHLTIEGALGLGAVTHGRTFAAWSLVERVHVGYRVPIGLQGGLSLMHGGALFGDEDDGAELFFIGPEARYHPFGERCVDPWLGVAFGFGSLDEQGSSPWRREKWSGASFLVQAGALFRVTRTIALGAWIGTTLGLWEQSCMLSDPYQLEHCVAHRDARVMSIGMSIAPRVTRE